MMKMTEKHRKALSLVSLLLLLLFFLFITVFLGKPLMSFLKDPEAFRLWVEEKGWLARVFFVGMMVLQVVVALIPGEPLEIAAGVAFGSIEGTLLVMAGIAIGSTIIFLLVRLFGVKLVEVFFSMEKIHSLKFLQNHKRLEGILLLVMMIPGTPKDLISYFVGLTPIKLGRWIFLTSFARIPSVVTSTLGGDALGEERYLFAAAVFLVTAGISLLGLFFYDRMVSKRKEKNKDIL